ncbi:MAG: hypothetical protein ACI4CT_06890 [Lachnospiraceae bacterium]
MAICSKQHRYLQGFNELPEAQDNRNGGRHICAGCAYVEGLKDALQNNTRQKNLSHLPDSQAGTVRHKSAIDAYNLGYKYGEKISS